MTTKPMTSREETDKKIEERRAALEKDQKVQDDLDEAARLELLEEFDDVLGEVTIARFKRGFPVRVFVRTPDRPLYKRYQEEQSKARASGNAHAERESSEKLARACWVYPRERDAQDAMLEQFSGLLAAIHVTAARLAEGKIGDEGKG